MILKSGVTAFCLFLSSACLAQASETLIGKFRNTNYYFAFESEYRGPATAEVLGMDDSRLALVSVAFKKALLMEGTGELIDGRVINYAGKKDNTARFAFTRHRYGRGVANCPLSPFRSIAVDPSLIALGSKVRIAETVGMVLPDGSIHDGIWLAVDIGGAIVGDRVDLFIEKKQYSSYLLRAGITHMEALSISLVSGPSPVESQCLSEAAE